jgi:hypothetical protein
MHFGPPGASDPWCTDWNNAYRDPSVKTNQQKNVYYYRSYIIVINVRLQNKGMHITMYITQRDVKSLTYFTANQFFLAPSPMLYLNIVP